MSMLSVQTPSEVTTVLVTKVTKETDSTALILTNVLKVSFIIEWLHCNEIYSFKKLMIATPMLNVPILMAPSHVLVMTAIKILHAPLAILKPLVFVTNIIPIRSILTPLSKLALAREDM